MTEYTDKELRAKAVELVRQHTRDCRATQDGRYLRARLQSFVIVVEDGRTSLIANGRWTHAWGAFTVSEAL